MARLDSNVAILATLIAVLAGVAALMPEPDQLMPHNIPPPVMVPNRTALVSGPVHVIDGDTVRVGAVTIRLEGIDAPEGGQTCHRDGAEYDCGATARDALDRLMTRADAVCAVTGRDKYRRLLGECWSGDADRSAGRPSLNAEMVRLGHAVAYRHFSHAYVPQEDEARAALRGIWAGKFIEPHEWRKQQRDAGRQ